MAPDRDPTSPNTRPIPIPAPRPRHADAALILDFAAGRVARLWASDLPFSLKVQAHGDVLLQVGRDLDRAAAHTARIMHDVPEELTR